MSMAVRIATAAQMKTAEYNNHGESLVGSFVFLCTIEQGIQSLNDFEYPSETSTGTLLPSCQIDHIRLATS